MMDWEKVFKTTALPKQGDDTLMATAYHEAGHAMVDLLLGVDVDSVTIVPGKGTLGTTVMSWQRAGCDDEASYRAGTDIPDGDIMERVILGLLGGIIGGAVYSGRYDWEASGDDLGRILDAHLSYGITDIPTLQPYWDKAYTMIMDNRAALEKIAGDLYRKKTLGVDCLQIFISLFTDG